MPSWFVFRLKNNLWSQVENNQVFIHTLSNRRYYFKLLKHNIQFNEFNLFSYDSALGFFVISKFILNIPFLWALLLGYFVLKRWINLKHKLKIRNWRFIICGVSPAVIVPMMIECQEAKLGTTKKIPSLVISASCIDNIVAIAGHSLVIGIIFNTGLHSVPYLLL